MTMTIDMQNVKFVNGAAPRLCQQCGRFFLQYRHGSAQKRCPTCTDVHQLRPSVAVERELIAEYDGVAIMSLPAEWTSKPAKANHDDDYFEIDVRGRDIAAPGEEWSGRICLYADYPFQPDSGEDEGGDVVKIRHMRTSHLVRAKYALYQTKDGASVTRRKTLPVGSSNGQVVFDAVYGKDVDSVPVDTERYETESREYFVFMRTQSPAVRELFFVVAGDTSDCLELGRISAGASAHRLVLSNKTTSALAVAPEDEQWLGPTALAKLTASVEEGDDDDE